MVRITYLVVLPIGPARLAGPCRTAAGYDGPAAAAAGRAAKKQTPGTGELGAWRRRRSDERARHRPHRPALGPRGGGDRPVPRLPDPAGRPDLDLDLVRATPDLLARAGAARLAGPCAASQETRRGDWCRQGPGRAALRRPARSLAAAGRRGGRQRPHYSAARLAWAPSPRSRAASRLRAARDTARPVSIYWELAWFDAMALQGRERCAPPGQEPVPVRASRPEDEDEPRL